MAGEAIREHADRLAVLIDALLILGPCDPCYEDHDYQEAAECECSCHTLDRGVQREAHRGVIAYRTLIGAYEPPAPAGDGSPPGGDAT